MDKIVNTDLIFPLSTKNYFPFLFATDRGFNSKANDRHLNKEKIFNAICCRDPQELNSPELIQVNILISIINRRDRITIN